MKKKITKIILMLLTLTTFSCLTTEGLTDNLRSAIYQGDLELVKELVEKGADIYQPDNFETTPFFEACREGQIDIVEYFLSLDNSRVNDYGRFESTSVRTALFNGHFDLVKLLVDNGADLNKGSNGIAFFTLNNKSFEALKFVVEDLGVDISSEKLLLHAAPMRNVWEAIPYLVEMGFDVNELEGKKRGLLRYSSPNIDTVNYLIAQGANINNIPNDGLPPVSSAAYEGRVELVQLYIDRGALLNPEDNDNEEQKGTPLSPLLAAIFSRSENKVEIASMLLEAGVDPDFPLIDEEGSKITPLTIAANNQEEKVVELLLEFGANFSEPSSLGSPLSIAKEKGNDNIIKLLTDAGATD